MGSGLVSVARCPADATINCVQSPDLQMELNVGAFGPSRRLVMGASTQLLQLRGGGGREGEACCLFPNSRKMLAILLARRGTVHSEHNYKQHNGEIGQKCPILLAEKWSPSSGRGVRDINKGQMRLYNHGYKL